MKMTLLAVSFVTFLGGTAAAQQQGSAGQERISVAPASPPQVQVVESNRCAELRRKWFGDNLNLRPRQIQRLQASGCQRSADGRWVTIF